MAKPSQRNRTIVRTWTVLHLIGQHPSTLNELAGALDVTTRTIRRDLEALEEAGFPLYTDDDLAGDRRWHLLTKGIVPERRAA